jgi:hypothetical protein
MKRCVIVLLLMVLAALGSSGLAWAGQETSASQQAPYTVSAAEFLASLAAPTVGESCAILEKTTEIGVLAPLAAACTNTCTIAKDCPRCPRTCPAECLSGCCLCPCR